MKKVLCILTLLCAVCTGAWADPVYPESGNYYKMHCLARSGHERAQYISISDGVISPNSATGTYFEFERANNDGQWYIKDVESGKYLDVARVDAGQTIILSETSSIYWTTTGPYHTDGIRLHPNGDETKWLNNVNNVLSLKNGGATGECSSWVLEKLDISLLQEKIDNVCASIVSEKVGYPILCDEVQTLFNYRSTASSFVRIEITPSNYETAEAALNAVYALTDVNLPQDGKAYYIKGHYANGATKYLVHDGSSHSLTLSDNPEAFIVGSAAGSKYVLVGEDNYYFAVTASGKNANVHEIYDADKCAITLAHVAPNFNGSSKYTESNPEVYFGTLAIQGKCGNETFYIMSKPAGTLHNSYSDYVAYNTQSDNYLSSLFEFEEVENPNKLKLFNPNPKGSSGLDNKSVGTFSAPFAVQLPDGVEAYKATVDGSTVTFETIGSVVPANTGVLVYAENGATYDNVNAVPAAAVAPTVEVNVFEAMIDGTINEGDYVLGKGTNGVGFYARVSATTAKNKAYIPASAASQINAFRFDFEEQTTGVESLQSEKTTGMAFDLAGRRINANAKGISIVNGKKYIK